MNVYSILVHPNYKSLNGALFDTANTFFSSQGHTVRTLELFSIEKKLAKAAHSMYDAKPQHAGLSSYLSNWLLGNTTNFVKDEIARVKSADLLYIQSPIWVYSMPALFKSYVEQIFLYKQFFCLNDTASADKFGIKHLTSEKKVLLSLTLGGSKEMVAHVLGNHDNVIQYPKNLFENLLGYEFLAPHVTWATTESTMPNQKYIDDFKIHLTTLGM